MDQPPAAGNELSKNHGMFWGWKRPLKGWREKRVTGIFVFGEGADPMDGSPWNYGWEGP